MKLNELRINDGIYSISAIIINCGQDINISICGGTDYHIGAVALAIPYSSLKADGSISANVNIMCVSGHKDNEVAAHAAEHFAKKWNCNVCASAGIHIDNASALEIERIWNNYLKLIQLIDKADEMEHVK